MPLASDALPSTPPVISDFAINIDHPIVTNQLSLYFIDSGHVGTGEIMK